MVLLDGSSAGSPVRSYPAAYRCRFELVAVVERWAVHSDRWR